MSDELFAGSFPNGTFLYCVQSSRRGYLPGIFPLSQDAAVGRDRQPV